MLPTISIVTPTYNRAGYLAEAMDSVLSQRYPGLEYIVIDGGSTDHTRQVIKARERDLHFWSSAPDSGMYDALNKGFERSTGEVMGWLNSDDKYPDQALHVVGEIFAKFPQIGWLTSLFPLALDASGKIVKSIRLNGFSRKSFYGGENLPGHNWYASGWIQQESTFWRRSLWEASGARLDEAYTLAADFELWARFFKNAELYGVAAPLGAFRSHGDQLTADRFEEYLAQARQALLRHGGRPRGRVVSQLLGRADDLPRTMRRRLGLSGAKKKCVHTGPLTGWEIVDA